MIDVFTVHPFKNNHRQVKISVFTLRCAVCLCGILHTAESVSAVCCTPPKLSLWCVAHCLDCFRGVLHTAEIVSSVCCIPLRSSPRCTAHRRD